MTLSTTPLQDFFLAQRWTGDVAIATSIDSGTCNDRPKPLVVVTLIQDNARVNHCRNPLTKQRRHQTQPSRWNSGGIATTSANTKSRCHHRRGSADDIDDGLISAMVDHRNRAEAEQATGTANFSFSLSASNLFDSPPQKPWRKRSTKKQDQPPMSPSRKQESWPSTQLSFGCEDCPELLHVEHQQAKRAPSAA